MPAAAAATLRELQLLDSDTERLVFRAQASEVGIVLVGEDDDLEDLTGYVAAEATTNTTSAASGGSTAPSRSSPVQSRRHGAHEARPAWRRGQNNDG
jgi:hypothetical protein